MKAKELFDAGKLEEALQALNAEVRDNPTDSKRRTFLFELLCFAGEYDRAEKQLEILGELIPALRMGALLYQGVLTAERTRVDLFRKREYPVPASAGAESRAVTGTLNGAPFQSLSDADPRIGPRLEIFSAGSYLWVPLEHVASVDVEPPRRLRDLLWAPAVVRTGPGFQDRELGEVLLPVLSPCSWEHVEDDVRLGRATVWERTEAGEEIPFGQKMLLVDGEEVPILEVRKLEIHATPPAPAGP